ncbi:hypothetical protein [Algoriphagus taiwanensis]|uniref:Tetratricopeptide repeat protein n=1 Tax=Algoriphagus taiwanensis TaxID=1445656 RepID=A0ABQ6PZF0_9BACT|nr:hypothetical protein Ataiwa_04390 [Algoriphagus taiwanensis]
MSQPDFAAMLPDYLMGRLDPKTKAELEQALSQSETLRMQLEDEKRLRRMIHRQSREELRIRVRNLDQETASSKWKTWVAAAMIPLLLGLGYLFWTQSAQKPATDYLSYFESYPNTVLPFVRGEEKEDPAWEAFMAYENREFAKAAELFDQLNETESKDEWVFYEAMSNMELQDWDNSIKLLENHSWTSEEKGSFGDVKDWYLALALLYSGKKEEAQQQLRNLFLRQGYEYINAGKLLEQLEKEAPNK